jgi:hypothetical protein
MRVDAEHPGGAAGGTEESLEHLQGGGLAGPLGPSRATIWPEGMSKLTPSTAVKSAKRSEDGAHEWPLLAAERNNMTGLAF